MVQDHTLYLPRDSRDTGFQAPTFYHAPRRWDCVQFVGCYVSKFICCPTPAPRAEHWGVARAGYIHGACGVEMRSVTRHAVSHESVALWQARLVGLLPSSPPGPAVPRGCSTSYHRAPNSKLTSA